MCAAAAADEIRYAIHIFIFMYTRGHKIRRQNVYDSMHRVLSSGLCVAGMGCDVMCAQHRCLCGMS